MSEQPFSATSNHNMSFAGASGQPQQQAEHDTSSLCTSSHGAIQLDSQIQSIIPPQFRTQSRWRFIILIPGSLRVDAHFDANIPWINPAQILTNTALRNALFFGKMPLYGARNMNQNSSTKRPSSQSRNTSNAPPPLSQQHELTRTSVSTQNSNNQSIQPAVTSNAVVRQHHVAPVVARPTATSLQALQIPRSSFRPNYMVSDPLNLKNRAYGSRNSISNAHYLSDSTSASNLNQDVSLPDEENCALWISNIPLQTTYKEMFDKINVGKVFALHMFDPDATHSLKAAKLVFFAPEAAQRMYTSSIFLHGQRLRFRYNRHPYIRNTRMDYSRVLIIEGPAETMNADIIATYCEGYAIVAFDRILQYPSNIPGRIQLEVRFARVDGQAETCHMAIQAEPGLQGSVTARYGRDPCEPRNLNAPWRRAVL